MYLGHQVFTASADMLISTLPYLFYAFSLPPLFHYMYKIYFLSYGHLDVAHLRFFDDSYILTSCENFEPGFLNLQLSEMKPGFFLNTF